VESLDLFWLHLIEYKKLIFGKDDKNFHRLFYSYEKGFLEESGENDLFIISTSPDEEFQQNIDLLEGNLFLSHNNLPKGYLDFIRLYFPLIVAKYFTTNKPLVLAHLAQTLDGKICTSTGKSKWISNEENLDHAHRVRAMSDAVLVGGVTLKEDNPQLNVRRVEGDNPIRIFWCNSLDEFSAYKVDFAKTILIREKHHSIANTFGLDDVINYTSDDNEVSNVLVELKKIGIHSLFIEGGSHTIRKFHEARAVDLLQVYIAPMIFGCGKNGFEMDYIDEVDQALKIEGYFVPMGDHIMYSGKPLYKIK
jgi:diaminohydroxyphosphoribosylaminopyrimidine deaminase / 5-amino-6-(5-phosphoribosylamino)uracil reductase